MNKFLASVTNAQEALQVCALGVDFIDLKQPAHGALGALPFTEVADIVRQIARRSPVSATVGDLPMHPELIAHAVQTMLATGVDYVKIGFFPAGNWPAVLAQLQAITARHALIAVLFADTLTDVPVLANFKQAGFTGVMLDTRDKQRGALPQVLTKTQLTAFVTQAKQLGLLCGLAGALRLADVAPLLDLRADYLGFRGALCQGEQRTAALNPQAVSAIQQALRG